MSAKKQLLDPIGSLCKLLSLIFHDDNTKISVQDHVLALQEPNGLQWVIRSFNGDGRENISELYYVLIRLIKWYILPDYNVQMLSEQRGSKEVLVVQEHSNGSSEDSDESDDEQNVFMMGEFSSDSHTSKQNNEEKTNSSIKYNKSEEGSSSSNNENYYTLVNSPELRKMIKYLCDAFERLQERTYEYGNVVLALQYYIIILKSALDGSFSDSMLPKYILEKDKEYETLLDYNKLKNLWNVNKLHLICELYENCFNVEKDESMTIDTQKNLIKSYLKSVDSILEESDREFQKLIINSNRG